MNATTIPPAAAAALARLPFLQATEQDEFRWELGQLARYAAGRCLLRAHLLPDLLTIYRLAEAGDTVLRRSLRLLCSPGERTGRLVAYVRDLLAPGHPFPAGHAALDTLAALAARGIPVPILRGLLADNRLASTTTEELQLLRQASPVALDTWVAYRDLARGTMAEQLHPLALQIITSDRAPAILNTGGAQQLNEFLSTVFPAFAERFAHRLTVRQLADEPARISRWLRVWMHHRSGGGQEGEAGTSYFATDFTTIVRNVPEHLWWNDGIAYGAAGRQYCFGSPEFYWLATGGSVRRTPTDYRPYTRGMARAFVAWTEETSAPEEDAYLALYARSLGAGPQLQQLTQRFVRHDRTRQGLQAELDRWNPVLQKLSDPAFEELDLDTATPLLGYLYHCLRDQPGFRVTRHSLAKLQRDATGYYERIARRRTLAEQRAAARARAANQTPNQSTWDPAPNLQRLIEDYKAYARIRKRQIAELLNEQELTLEGQALKHCVGGYARLCRESRTSIWSLRELSQSGTWRSIVTIEVRKQHIVQVRGRFNAEPQPGDMKFIQAWARMNKLQFSP